MHELGSTLLKLAEVVGAPQCAGHMCGFVVHEVFSVDPESTAYVDDVPLMVAFSASMLDVKRYTCMIYSCVHLFNPNQPPKQPTRA